MDRDLVLNWLDHEINCPATLVLRNNNRIDSIYNKLCEIKCFLWEFLGMTITVIARKKNHWEFLGITITVIARKRINGPGGGAVG